MNHILIPHLLRWFSQTAEVYSLIIMVQLLYSMMLLAIEVFQLDLVTFHKFKIISSFLTVPFYRHLGTSTSISAFI